MIRFHLFGTRIVLPLPILLMPILAARLGLRGQLHPVFLALAVHEGAHLLSARLFRVRIEELRLAPFGGSARIENPYGVSAGRIIPVAAAGAFANLCAIVLLSALANWGWFQTRDAACLLKPHMTLLLFNLLPALPLDGGRILYAALSARLRPERAFRIALYNGRILSLFLLAAALYGGISLRKWNLTLIMAAILILASANDEQDALLQAWATKLASAFAEPREARPARIYEVDGKFTARDAIKMLRPQESAWFVPVHDGKRRGMIGTEQILQHLMRGGAPDTVLQSLLEGDSIGQDFLDGGKLFHG